MLSIREGRGNSFLVYRTKKETEALLNVQEKFNTFIHKEVCVLFRQEIRAEGIARKLYDADVVSNAVRKEVKSFSYTAYQDDGEIFFS